MFCLLHLLALPLLAVCPGGEEPEYPEGHLHHAEDADPGEKAQDTACKEDFRQQQSYIHSPNQKMTACQRS